MSNTRYWLVKSEPSAYSWDDLMREGKTLWDGVRNFQARNFMRQMQVGDAVLFYHSMKQKAVVGIAEVTRTAYPDPTASSGDWSVVDIKPVGPIERPVTLAEIRQHPKLQDMPLIKQSRLSVMPVPAKLDKVLRSLAGL